MHNLNVMRFGKRSSDIDSDSMLVKKEMPGLLRFGKRSASRAALIFGKRGEMPGESGVKRIRRHILLVLRRLALRPQVKTVAAAVSHKIEVKISCGASSLVAAAATAAATAAAALRPLANTQMLNCRRRCSPPLLLSRRASRTNSKIAAAAARVARKIGCIADHTLQRLRSQSRSLAPSFIHARFASTRPISTRRAHRRLLLIATKTSSHRFLFCACNRRPLNPLLSFGAARMYVCCCALADAPRRRCMRDCRREK